MTHITTFRNNVSPLTRGALFYLCYWGAIGTYLPFLNVYFEQDLHFSGRQISILALFPPLMSLVFAMPLSSLADRRQWRIRILTACVAIMMVLLLFASILETFFAWVIMMLIFSVFLSPIIPLADSLMARMAAQYNLNFGSMRMWGSFSFATLAIAGGALWQQVGFKPMFLAGSIGLLPVLLFTNTLEERYTSTETQTRQGSIREIGQDTGILVLLVASFLIGAAIYNSVVYDGIYMSKLGGSQLFIGLMFGFSAFSEVPVMQYSGKLIARLGQAQALLVAYSFLLVAYAGYVWALTPMFLVLMAAIKGVGFGLFYVGTVRILSERTPTGWDSTVQAMYSVSTFGLAPLFVALISGEIYDRFGASTVFIFNIGTISLAALLLTVVLWRGLLTTKKLR
ncbi:MFS transporter [Anaerolineales bacterium HSG6]|nr:MFS transporter [Anaerolineales bacterium HSG6]MDM8529957.1 MFS transporter [Anaerolineales bacterium HSG25]